MIYISLESCQRDAEIICESIIPKSELDPAQLAGAMLRAYNEIYQGTLNRFVWGDITRRAIRECLPPDVPMPAPYDRPTT